MPSRAGQFTARYTDSAGNAVCEPFESGGVCNQHCTSVLQSGGAKAGCSCLEAEPCS
ncbi:MAG: hypothetical protein IT370_18355 [Deltaproteobacteria bacterium]|nr:hypothetical protein [Deltaproteobacteria bacterium]